jgi:uncharacterized spore protein YtfJ
VVFGAPVERGGVTVIPVARIRWGVGGGGGRSGSSAIDGERDSGEGAGGGVVADPAGYVEIGPGGAVYQPIGRRFSSPGFVLAAGVAVAIVLRALARLRG